MSINKCKLCVNVLIHQDKTGRVIYHDHCFRSLEDAMRYKYSQDTVILVFLNGGRWEDHQDVKDKISEYELNFHFADSPEMLNIGKVRNTVAYDYPISEYFTHMDGDDEVTKNYFDSLFDNMNRDITRFRFIWKNVNSSDVVPNHKHFGRNLMYSDYLPNVTYLIKRDWYLNTGLKHPEDLTAGEDIMWSLLLHLHFNHIYMSMDIIYIYRNDLSQMTSEQKNDRPEVFHMTQNILKYFQSQMFNLDLLPEYHVNH